MNLGLPRIQSGLVRAPAMVMALGIFLLFAGRFLIKAVAPAAVERSIHYGAYLLGAWCAYLFCLFADQALRDRKVLWDYTVDHFAIGTWVAGVNVYSRVILPYHPAVARAGSIVGVALWLAYMVWFSGMVRRTELRARLGGVAFLTTVATQSVVVSGVRIWSLPNEAYYVLLGLNLLGLSFYLVHFYLVWIVRGVRKQIESWSPPNNITHGALSITILAAELLATQMPSARRTLQSGIEAAWVVDCFLFIAVFSIELVVLRRRGLGWLRFQMANWARNFTYGMFFACTYYGATELHDPLLSAVAGRAVLLALALLVAAANAWELGNQVAGAVREPRFALKAVQHG